MVTQEQRPWRLTVHEECFVFASLMLVTCFFLPWVEGRSPWDILVLTVQGGGTPFWVGLLALLCFTPFAVRFPHARPWIGMVAVLAINAALMMTLFASDWGAQLTRLFAAATLVLSVNPAITKARDFAMKRLNSQKAEVFNHWGTALHELQFSAQEFYTKLESRIQARQWPGVELLRVVHTEAGLLSHKREYLRVIRQRQVFDICAATFGKDYFFTMREAEIKPQLTFTTVLIFLLTLSLLFSWSLNSFGLFTGAMFFAQLLVVAFFVMWSAPRMGLTQLDGLLMRTPGIGPIYEAVFRRSTTYFQHDTRMVFLKLMDDLVKEQVDEETSAKGIKLLSCFEHRPMFNDFYVVSARVTGNDATAELPTKCS